MSMAGNKNKRVFVGVRHGTSRCAATTTPPSALRKGKFDASSPKAKSKSGLGIVYEAFGENLSLYQVLRVQPSAQAAELRKAYLKQGKAALVNGGIHNMTDGAKGALQNYYNVPDEVRKKFQAVSLAYEVLSTPELRSYYDQYRDLPLKSSSSLTAKSSIVQWDEFVEEKIIWDIHPDEHHHSRPDADFSYGKETRDVHPTSNGLTSNDDGEDYDQLEREQSMIPFSPCTAFVQCMDYDARSNGAGPFGILGLLPHNNDDMTECTWEQLSDASENL